MWIDEHVRVCQLCFVFKPLMETSQGQSHVQLRGYPPVKRYGSILFVYVLCELVCLLAGLADVVEGFRQKSGLSSEFLGFG